MRVLQVSITLSILALLGVVLFLAYRHRSPGQVSQVHASATVGCATCHGDGQRDLATACNACHEEIERQMQTGNGLHGRMQREQVTHCGRCHEEHRGRDYRLVSDHTFVIAGLGTIDSFLHQGVDFGLSGRHAHLPCQGCHQHAADAVLQKGHKRFLGLRQDCVTCHRDPHDGKLRDCASCHGQEQPFGQVALFRHDPRFPLVHSHAGLDCKRCHEPGSRFAIENVGHRRAPAVRGCADCHETRHSARFLAATAGTGCTACHRLEHGSFTSADEKRSHDLHGASGFDLLVPHHEVACQKCHRGPSHTDRFRSPPRSPNDCRGCHEDPHDGQFQEHCLSCHQAHTFRDHRFDRERHARAGFVLLGAHQQLACKSCHPIHEGVRRFRGLPKTCGGCHEDPHGDQFQHGAFKGQACTTCHNQVRFRPAAFTLAMHQRTRFPLEGAHAAVGCNRCHPGGSYRGTSTTCRNCHVDVHEGAFARRGAGCADCHDTRAFRLREAQAFDHGRWTGFELAGAHAKTACRGCHPPGPPTHDGTRRMSRATSGCADCHRDPHAGQFRRGTGTDCSRCHSVQRGFDLTHFDHDRHSRFKLDEKHRSLRCDQCHKRYPVPGGATVVRYRPLGTKCNDCHGWERKR